MMVDFLHFLCQYILAGFVVNYTITKLLSKDSPAANALAFCS